MGIRARKSGDRLRTIWTPEMDRYFIDLMLEQVEKGNRIDDTLFSKQAWKQMMSSFNSKFNCKYVKDILKNRHKTLRNLYKAVRAILSHRGFVWNETRHMVTAENSVWEEYLKDHVTARSFQMKVIPFYEDLCTIYEKACAEESIRESANGLSDTLSKDTSGLAEDHLPLLPANSEGPGEMVLSQSFEEQNAGIQEALPSNVAEGDTVSSHQPATEAEYSISLSVEDLDIKTHDDPSTTNSTPGTRTRTYWQPSMDRYFIDLMVDQVRKGYQVDGVFRKHSWAEMISQFNTKFGFKYDMDILKNRYKTLRKQYNLIKKILETDGFKWDEIRQMVAADDVVWQNYIKVHTEARQFMTRPVPYYKDLCFICRDLDSDDGYPVCEETINLGSSGRECELVHVKVVSSHESMHQLENPDFPNPKKPRLDSEHSASDKISPYPFSDPMKDQGTHSFSVETLVQEVQSLPDMDDDLVIDACVLLEDEKKARTFLALDVKLRRKWLIRKLRLQQL